MTLILFETKHLRIRKFTLNDAEFIFKLLNEPEWIQYIGDRKITSLYAARKYISDSLFSSYQTHGFGPFAIELKKNGQLIGMTCLIKRDEFEHVDLGFALLKEFTGQGYALEAADATLYYAQNHLHLGNLVAITNYDNASSKKLLHKLGFVYCKQVLLQGETEPVLYYTKTLYKL